MKKTLLTLAVLFLSVAFVNAQAINGKYTGGSGLKASPHNMSYSSSFGGKTTGAQICVFCHTPHNKITTLPTSRLWNHNVNLTQTYTGSFSGLSTSSYSYQMSVDSTAAGKTPTFFSYRSLLCLSCHDGQTAISDTKNPIWEVSAGTTIANNGGANLDGNLHLQNVNGVGPLLGTDLSDDHPVGIAYPTYTAGSGGYGDTNGLVGKTFNQNFGNVGSGTGTAIYTQPWTAFPSNMASLSPMRLYINNWNTGKPMIECATCHDVHNSGGYKKLLRMDNDQSAMCLRCHVTK